MAADRFINTDTKMKKAVENHPVYSYRKTNYYSEIVVISYHRFWNLFPYKREKTLAYSCSDKIECYTDEIFDFLDQKLPDVTLIRKELGKYNYADY